MSSIVLGRHSTACHMDESAGLRVAGVNRWTPWWFNDTYCDHGQMSGWLTLQELEALPTALQPLLRHRCLDCYTAENGSEFIQQAVLDRLCSTTTMRLSCSLHVPPTCQPTRACAITGAEAAMQRNEWGFDRIGEPGLPRANEHLEPVRVAKL